MRVCIYVGLYECFCCTCCFVFSCFYFHFYSCICLLMRARARTHTHTHTNMCADINLHLDASYRVCYKERVCVLNCTYLCRVLLISFIQTESRGE